MIARAPYHRHVGFTLLELMVTLVLAAILLALGGPSLNELRHNNRLASQLNEFISDVNLARSEAITRSTPVTICKSTSLTGCGGTHWEGGWIVFTDADGDGTVDAGDDTILRKHQALPTGYTLRSGSHVRITYATSGFAIGFNDTWTLCDSTASAQRARAAIVNNNGRLRAAEDTDGDGIRDDGETTPTNLSCP